MDAFESGLDKWTASGDWGITASRSSSPTHSATDTAGTFYADNSDTSLTLATGIDLSGATRPALSFQQAYSLEEGYDFAQVEISTNGGSSWLPPAATFTGDQMAMSREQVDLLDYKGCSDVRVRFRLVTDDSIVKDGWYVDDVSIGEAPAPVTVQVLTNTSPNRLSLTWSATTDGNFAVYRIYRSLAPVVDWRMAHLVTEITNPATTNYTDFTVSPKTTYYYAVMVLNTAALHSLSATASGTTPAGMDYPFVDNGEGGSRTWNATAPWALSDEDSASPSHAWSDSPGTNYANTTPSLALTLVAPMDLTAAVAPVLSFAHKYAFASGDAGYVEVSVNQGTDWTALSSFTGTATNAWQQGRASLATYAGAPTVLVRFRLTADASANADGWHVDDISVAESPDVVLAPVLDNVTSHTIQVIWNANTNSQFSHYVVVRSLTPGVGINSTVAGVITNQGTTTFTDTNLALDTVYYYRVYAVGPYGTYSPDSATETSARTLNNPTPFADDFESGLINWNLTGNWGLTTNGVFQGTFALTDSPQGTYDNSTDSYALTAVNLVGTTWPVLRFSDRHRLAGNDWARLEVSPNGTTWYPIYGVMGVRTNWNEASVDLSPWKNQANLRLRFRMVTDGSTTEDGWFIDALSVTDQGAQLAWLPVQENFETSLTNWLAAGWLRDTNQAYEGEWSSRAGAGRKLSPDTQYWMEYGRELSLTNLANPQLTFWLRGQLVNYSRFRVQVSKDGGLNWAELPEVNGENGMDIGWTRKQASLQSYAGQTIRIRFNAYSYNGYVPDSDITVDKITLDEMPAAVTLETLTPHLRSVDVTWSATTLGAAFQRYEVYQATHANVTPADTLVGSFTNPAELATTDTGLTIGSTYYYRVFAVDTNDTYIPSNERSTTTVPVTLPLTDDFTTADQWVTTGAWGVTVNGGLNGRTRPGRFAHGRLRQQHGQLRADGGESGGNDLARAALQRPPPPGGQRLGAAGSLAQRHHLVSDLRRDGRAHQLERSVGRSLALEKSGQPPAAFPHGHRRQHHRGRLVH